MTTIRTPLANALSFLCKQWTQVDVVYSSFYCLPVFLSQVTSCMCFFIFLLMQVKVNFTPKIKMQILRTIHIGNVWVMLGELIATSAIVWAKYKMPCSPLCTSYLWVEFEGRTFTLIITPCIPFMCPPKRVFAWNRTASLRRPFIPHGPAKICES